MFAQDDFVFKLIALVFFGKRLIAIRKSKKDRKAARN